MYAEVIAFVLLLLVAFRLYSVTFKILVNYLSRTSPPLLLVHLLFNESHSS